MFSFLKDATHVKVVRHLLFIIAHPWQWCWGSVLGAMGIRFLLLGRGCSALTPRSSTALDVHWQIQGNKIPGVAMSGFSESACNGDLRWVWLLAGPALGRADSASAAFPVGFVGSQHWVHKFPRRQEPAPRCGGSCAAGCAGHPGAPSSVEASVLVPGTFLHPNRMESFVHCFSIILKCAYYLCDFFKKKTVYTKYFVS